MSVTRKRWFDVTVTVDEPIRLQIKRMSSPEFEAFHSQFTAFGEGRGAPLGPSGSADVATRALIQAHAEYLRANAEWQREAFELYVRVIPGELYDEDDEGHAIPVLTGGHFADVFGGQPVIATVLMRIWTENRLSDAQKKTLSWRSTSATGSSETPLPAGPGETPAPAATAAAPEGSARAEAATDSPGEPWSGITVPSPSGRVQ